MKAWLHFGVIRDQDFHSIFPTETEARAAHDETELNDENYDWSDVKPVEVPIPNQITEALDRLMDLLDRDDVLITDEVAEVIDDADTDIRKALGLLVELEH